MPVVQIRRSFSFRQPISRSYHDQLRKLCSAVYQRGLSTPEAAWANRKYHGHRTLPPEVATKLKNEQEKTVQQLNDV